MKVLRVVALIVLTFGVLVAAVIWGVNYQRSNARHAWKEQAILLIAQRTGDPKWAPAQLELLRIKGPVEPEDSKTWLTKQMVLMQNGEWISFVNICAKENWRIDDLFIGKGSNGKWYYSTYHFCVEAYSLTPQTQSVDLADFAKSYYLRTFDGHSDECLQKTVPPENMDAK